MSGYQSEFEVQLPIGFTDPAGKVQRQAILRKMRGHEEALLYDTGLVAGRLVTELLKNCLVRLGETTPVPVEAVQQLYSADRNYLLLELRRITLGDLMQATYTCPHCNHAVHLQENLSELKVRWLEPDQTLEDIQLELEDGYTDRQGTRHTQITLTLPTGVDEEFVTPMVARDPLKAQDALVLKCIKHFGTLRRQSLEAYGVKILRDLTLGDRIRLQACFNGNTPGVNFMRQVVCDACGAVFDGVLDIASFFVSG